MVARGHHPGQWPYTHKILKTMDQLLYNISRITLEPIYVEFLQKTQEHFQPWPLPHAQLDR